MSYHMLIIWQRASYMTHIVITLTLMALPLQILPQPLANPTNLKKNPSTGTTAQRLFNDRLSQPLKDEDRDPLWGSAALLGAITIASTEATKPSEAWPLKPPDPSDLDWLRMSDGKKEVWRLVNPLREGSVWRHALDYDHHKDPVPNSGPVPELNLLAPFLTKIYDYDPLAGWKTQTILTTQLHPSSSGC